MDLISSTRRLLRPVPVFALETVANACLGRLLERHPKLFDRLGSHRDKRYAFVPTDLDLTFVVTPRRRALVVLRGPNRPAVDVRIAGSIVTLLALLEGRLDGDAEFFARGVSVEGDMEAALALRNAMDDCRIDLPTDFAPAWGPLRRPAHAGLVALRRHLLTTGTN